MKLKMYQWHIAYWLIMISMILAFQLREKQVKLYINQVQSQCLGDRCNVPGETCQNKTESCTLPGETCTWQVYP